MKYFSVEKTILKKGFEQKRFERLKKVQLKHSTFLCRVVCEKICQNVMTKVVQRKAAKCLKLIVGLNRTGVM